MNMLEQIVEHKRQELHAKKKKFKISDFRSMELFGRQSISLHQSILDHPAIGIIGEIKRSSPSAGNIRNDFEPELIAKQYGAGGAAGISILTDNKYFSGSVDDLKSVRGISELPLLQKDFIIDEYQLFEAKASGADAVLLIASIHDRSELLELYLAASELGLESLVEIHDSPEIDRLDLDMMKLVGVNNRDLKTMKIDLNNSITISRHLPKSTTTVSESGIRISADLRRLKEAGFKAALIGEHLMKAEHPGDALKELLDGLKNETVC